MTGLERLGERIAREQDQLRGQNEPAHVQLRAALGELGAPARETRAASRNWIWLGAAAAATALALVAAMSLRPNGRAPLTVSIGKAHAPVAIGTWIEASRREPLQVSFSDGTRIDMGPRSRARLVELDNKGAHVLVESGALRVHVVHRTQTRFRLSVGPYKVLVTGTRFDVRWNPDQDAFELDLAEGHVEVSGCGLGQGYRMSAGQRVHAACKQRRFDVVEGKNELAGEQAALVAQPGVTAAARAAASNSADGVARSHVLRAPARAVAVPERVSSWSALAQQGKYTQAYELAKAAGFEVQCADAGSARELALLADAARYAGASRREAYTWNVLRRRFAGTPQAALAAFSLGRLEFDRHGSYQRAAQWFDTYLNEQPRGALHREARGRLIEATVRAGDLARAQSLAGDYLRDYPAGPHAELARSVRAGTTPHD